MWWVESVRDFGLVVALWVMDDRVVVCLLTQKQREVVTGTNNLVNDYTIIKMYASTHHCRCRPNFFVLVNTSRGPLEFFPKLYVSPLLSRTAPHCSSVP